MNKKIVAIIPARFESRRFPGKALVNIHGKSMIQRVFEQVSKLKILEDVIVATDDDRIMEHVRSFGGKALKTSKLHQSGTDRVAEVAKVMEDIDIIINVQGDEPLISPEQVKEVCTLLLDPYVEIGSLITKINGEAPIKDINVVKAFFDDDFYATQFSRKVRKETSKNNIEPIYYKHIGIYGFKRHILLKIADLKPGRLEQKENLEQLRWMENGFKIKLAITKEDSFSIDTPKDLQIMLQSDYFVNK